MVSQHFDRFVTADSRPAFITYLAKAFISESQETFELELEKEGNGTFFVHVEARISEGRSEFRIALVDITAKKKAEELLQGSERKYRTLFETMSQGVLQLGPDGKIISANPAAECILGLSFAQMQEKSSTDPSWCAIHEDGTESPWEIHPAMVALRTGKAVQNTVIGYYHQKVTAMFGLTSMRCHSFCPMQIGHSRLLQSLKTSPIVSV